MELQFLVFCATLLAVAGLSFSCRFLALSQMRRSPGIQTNNSLHPSELAYLFRPGDSAHCLIVLIVDTLQRELKSQKASEFQVSKLLYEAEVWSKIKAYIQDWSLQKAQQVLPEIASKNPLHIATGVWRLRFWFWNAIKGFFSELIQDPLQVRKYFSPVGLLRLFVSIAGSGVKEQLANSVRESLLKKEMLVPEGRKNAFARILGVLACLHLIAVAVVVALMSGLATNAIVFLLLFSALNGFLLRVAVALPLLLPHVEDVSRVLDSVSNKGIRIRLMRFLLGFARSSYWTFISIFSLLAFLVQAIILGQFFGMHSSQWPINIIGIFVLTLNFMLMIELCYRCFQVSSSDQLSNKGICELDSHHRELQKVKLVQAISTAMSEPAYNEQLSDIVAIYGVETLFLV